MGGLDQRRGFTEQVEAGLVRLLALATPDPFAPLATFCGDPLVKTPGAIHYVIRRADRYEDVFASYSSANGCGAWGVTA
jgi:hypothetical protein